ncbi:MAG: DUF2069 domain-containing protein [Porticoccaceae bacterium]|nr:DUF2069 domain-containing protein [Porticoccaceae bacterium]
MQFSLLPAALFSDANRNLRWAKAVSWVAYLSLIVSLICDGLLAETNPVLLLIAIIPLLIFLPGLFREDHRSLVMLCFVSLLYFTVIVTNLYEPDKTLFTVLGLVAVILLFIAAMMYSRWLRAKERSSLEDSNMDTDN